MPLMQDVNYRRTQHINNIKQKLCLYKDSALFFCKPESALQRVCGARPQSAGGSPAETFAAAHEHASWRALWCSGYNPCPLNDLWEPSLLLSQPLPTPSHVVHSQPPSWGGEYPSAHFPPQEITGPALFPTPCCSGEGVMWAKLSYSSYPHSNVRSNFFFPPTVWEPISLLWNTDFYEGCLINVF